MTRLWHIFSCIIEQMFDKNINFKVVIAKNVEFCKEIKYFTKLCHKTLTLAILLNYNKHETGEIWKTNKLIGVKHSLMLIVI